jgi:sulfur carrier protein ThiS adenylyltransferase
MRNERYRDLLPADRLAQTGVTIIGVGAIGRQVAIQTAAMGVPRIQLIDHDHVEESNLGTQAYFECDLGRPKVEATASLLAKLNPSTAVEARIERFAKSQPVLPVVFCCVDSIATRKHIFEAVHRTSQLFVDGRMAAEVLRVLTVTDALEARRYRQTLFEQDEAFREACTTRATIYCASVAAGLMVGQLAKWLRGIASDQDVSINLLATELAAT